MTSTTVTPATPATARKVEWTADAVKSADASYAHKMLTTAGREYRAHEKKGWTLTAHASLAVHAAERSGYLADGRNAKPGTISKSDMAALFGLADGSSITTWLPLGFALTEVDGFNPDSAIFGHAVQAAKRSATVRKAMRAEGATLASITEAVRAVIGEDGKPVKVTRPAKVDDGANGAEGAAAAGSGDGEGGTPDGATNVETTKVTPANVSEVTDIYSATLMRLAPKMTDASLAHVIEVLGATVTALQADAAGRERKSA